MKLTLLLFFAFTTQFVFAQKEDQFFPFDQDWKATKMKKAVYFIRVHYTADSNYEWTYYNMFGPRIKQQSFKDEKATIRNGKYAYYFPNGTIDSSGEYVNNALNGPWYFWTRNGKFKREKDYANGVVIKDTLFSISPDDQKSDTTLKPGEVESEYPGGIKSWQQYLGKNLHYPDRAISAEVMGEVRLQFIVDKDGSIINPEINKSVEYSLDEEALRIIKGSVNWSPASKDGVKLKSYKIQPIKFMLSRG